MPMMTRLRQVFDWSRPGRALRRYRVAPRQHPILFRRRLMQEIARELRNTELVVAHRSMPYSDTAL